MKKLIIAVIAFPLFASQSFAIDTNTSLKATTKISPKCDLSMTNISFGVYNPTTGDNFSTNDITIRCTNSTSVQVGINYSGSTNDNKSNDKFAYKEDGVGYSRFMSNGVNKLRYNLFQDAAFTKIFGGTNWFIFTPGAKPTIIGNGADQKVTVYAALAGGQYVKAGSYIDSLAVLVTF